MISTIRKLALLAGLLLAVPAAAQTLLRDGFEGNAAKTGLGTNLEGVEDFAAAYPFTDFFKQSRPWITASQTVFDTDDAAQLDSASRAPLSIRPRRRIRAACTWCCTRVRARSPTAAAPACSRASRVATWCR
jgi:hypothetical protein